MTATAEPTPLPGDDAAARAMRIGEVAELTGTTPRTIRYYEEIGLLSGGTAREIGKHRCYSPADVDRIKEIVRLKDLLGLSLDSSRNCSRLKQPVPTSAVSTRRPTIPAGSANCCCASRGHIENQLSLVRGRIAELSKLEADLSEPRAARRRKARRPLSLARRTGLWGRDPPLLDKFFPESYAELRLGRASVTRGGAAGAHSGA